MTLCIIGTNAFQGYWLWTTYRLNRQQFTRNIQDALLLVFRQHQVTEANRFSAKRPDTPPSPNDAQRGGMAPDTPPSPDETERGKMAPGTPPRRLSGVILLESESGKRVDLATLSVAYWAELHERGIDTRFWLDTLRTHPSEIRRNPTKLSNDVVTLLVPIPAAKNQFSRVVFETPTFYLLRRMGWLLGSSVFLLLLTTGSFLFMLSTILRQKKLSEIKNDFINNMTHELKTPIATVTAAVDALKHFEALNDPKKTQMYLTISQNNLQRLSDLVEKVLNLAVEENRQLVIQPEQISLNEVVSELVEVHQLKSSKPVTFQVDIPTDSYVTMDRIHFTNALNNLIDNSINYSYDKVTVRITFERNQQGWQLAVADDGIGIAKTYQSSIFDRFFRVPTGDLHPVKGYGLGLAYVREVIERHGGHISLSSELGKGSEFFLKFDTKKEADVYRTIG